MIHALPALVLALAAPAVLPQATDQEPGPEPAPWLQLPEGPLERTWAAVGPNTVPWAPAEEAAEDPFDAETGELDWGLWSDALRGLSRRGDGSTGDGLSGGSARASMRALALIAAADRRGRDAYAWLDALGPGDPEAVAGVLPYVFPGVPAGAALGPGGRPEGLAAGVRFTPQLPPPSAEEEAQGIFWREVIARGLRVDGTTFDLRLKLDGSGVLVEFENVQGPPVQVEVVLPAPDGFRLKSLYRDWELEEAPEGANEASIDWAGVPIELTVQPDELDPSVFARMARRRSRMPGTPGAVLPTVMAERGFELLLSGGDASPAGSGRGPWEAVRAAFSEVSGTPFALTWVDGPAPASSAPGPLAPYRIDFTRAGDPIALRRRITSALEARVRARR